MLGEILVEEGLVTEADVENALKFQGEHGGRLGECVVSMQLTSEEQIEEAINKTPRAPTSLKEIDVDAMLLLQLMVKGLHVENLETPSQIARAMGLRSSLIKELLQDAVERKLVAVVGQKNGKGSAFSELRYELTQAGRDWAVELLALSQYFGPAPVTLDAYTVMVGRQHITNDWLGRPDIQKAFEGLVIPDRFVDRLGPSINSGTAILVYGPAGNGKTTIAETVGGMFNSEIYVPYCFEVDGHIVKVFDPSVHKEVDSPSAGRSAASSTRPSSRDRRWVRCRRPLVITGGELTLDMLDLKYSERSRFYEAPLHIKALNGVFVIDDFGRQLAAPGDILNRWILPLNNRVDYLSLHTGKNFQVPFDELVIFSTNLHPSDLMDDAFLRRISYKIEVGAPSEPLFRQVFEDVCRESDIEFSEDIYHHVLKEIRGKDAPLAYYQPGFIARQILASCKFVGIEPQFTMDNVNDALLNLFVTEDATAAGRRRDADSARS